MNNYKSKISIIVPAYNCESTIKRCIESVIHQKYENYELIIINDGSKDNTDLVIKSILNKDNRKKIKYIVQENKGVSEARNKGLDIAQGDIITFLDSDDYYDPYFFQSIIKNISNNDILLYGYKTIFNNENAIMKYGKNFSGDKDFLFRELSKHNLFNPVCNKVYTRKIIGKTRFNIDLNIGE